MTNGKWPAFAPLELRRGKQMACLRPRPARASARQANRKWPAFALALLGLRQGKQMANGGLLLMVLLVAFSVLFSLDSAQAVGLIIKPKEINLSARTGKEAITEFLVINAGAEPAIYQISPDARPNEIKLEPADFQLEPNASQLVKVKIKISEPGRYKTDISVIARPMGAGGLTLASGVKLPLTVEVGGLAWWWYAAGLALFLLICLAAVFGVKWILSKISFQQDKRDKNQ